jgi:hypothetical protein
MFINYFFEFSTEEVFNMTTNKKHNERIRESFSLICKKIQPKGEKVYYPNLFIALIIVQNQKINEALLVQLANHLWGSSLMTVENCQKFLGQILEVY